MARAITTQEHDIMISSIRECGDWLIHKKRMQNCVFSDEGCETILQEGLANRERMRGDIRKIARGFYFDYQKAHGVEQFIIEAGAQPVVAQPVAEPVKSEPVVDLEPKSAEAVDVVNPFVSYVMNAVVPTVDKKVADCEKKVAETVADLTKKVNEVRKVSYEVVVKRDSTETVLNEIVHEAFPLVMCYVENDEPVYLTGPAGTGKNVLAEQVAKAMGLNFYPCSKITQEFQLVGYSDAYGIYHETQFYQAFKNGGVFFLDEADASIPEAMILLNGAIANRYFEFPCGRINAHPDFRVIASGNTCGMGANTVYNARSQLDGATLDRFGMIPVDYDERIELMCAGNDADLVAFFHQLRKVAKDRVEMVLSYRGITRCRKIGACASIEDAITTGVIKGLDATTVKGLADSMSAGSNRWIQGFKKVAQRL